MSCFMTGDPDKEYRTNKPPPTGRVRERFKGDTACTLQATRQSSSPGFPYPLSTRVPFPNKISCFVSTYVSLDNSFPSVRQEPRFGPWKGSPILQQMVTLVGLFFAETDILTTWGTQGPACLSMDQTQWPQLGPFCPWSPPDPDNWPEYPDR